jgi:endoglucanase
MNKVIIILLLFILMMSCNESLPPTVKYGQLYVDGIHLKNSAGEDLILRGVSFGWHNWWSQYYTPETVKWLAEDWNCTVIRAAMGVDPDSGYIAMPEWSVETISKIVDAAIENNIYVIIDWHSHVLHLNEALNFFAQMAEKYKDFPNIIYEIYNEPVNDSWTEVKNYSIEIIKEIRRHDPDNIILVGNPQWCQKIQQVADDPIIGFSNIMYTVHFYAATHKQWLRDQSDYALKKGIPVFISEYGACESTGDGDINEAEWQKWVTWMDKNRISWCKWMISDKKETSAALNPGASVYGNWKQMELSESGRKTRTLLRSYSD